MTTTAARPARVPASDRYEFQNPIGAGGMGTVYRALDRHAGQHVAIKVLQVKRSQNPMMHERLAREFRAASTLEHPNIVRALSFETDGEISFLVSELVEGDSLGDRIERLGRLPEDKAIRVIAQVAQALDYAHKRQVVHRDVKPDNILMLPDGRVKLTDFGLAKDYSDDNQDLTRPASGLGTPHFMAPEQFADAKSVDWRSDIYSLAATLYNLLSGRPPFEARTALAILTKKETVAITPLRSLSPGLSERVEEAIRAALDPDPDRRPVSCLEFFKLLTRRRRSKENVITTPAPRGRTTTPTGRDRRTAVRYAIRLGSCAVVDTSIHPGEPAEDRWPLVVQDVSAGGIGILLARRFEPGAVLSIDLAFVSGEAPQRLPVRVVRLEPAHGGHWVHGCVFDQPLTPQQLYALLRLR